MATKTTSMVRIRVEVEITTGGAYGDEWNLAELRKQAKDDALLMLRNRLANSLVRICSDPLVTVVTHEEQKP